MVEIGIQNLYQKSAGDGESDGEGYIFRPATGAQLTSHATVLRGSGPGCQPGLWLGWYPKISRWAGFNNPFNSFQIHKPDPKKLEKSHKE